MFAAAPAPMRLAGKLKSVLARGLFYFNPSDPAIFIQKRSGPGYTLNFAKFLSWLLALLLLGDIGFFFFIDLFHKGWR